MSFPITPRSALAITGLIGIVCATSSASRASSDEAWRAFRHDVASACRQAAADTLTIERISVDPWGSPHYGLARLVGTTGEHAPRQLLCVYNKQSHATEIGSPMSITPTPAEER